MRIFGLSLILFFLILGLVHVLASDMPDARVPLGLPAISYPENNPQTPEKIALGEKLFNDKRFSTTGEVSCGLP